MTTIAHPTKKGYRTIRLPLTESEYDRFLTDRSYAKARLEELYEEFAELFPDAFPWGYAFCGYTEPSIKQQLLCRRIRLGQGCTVFTIAPAAVAQKSPCERNRVIMGKESLLKHSQRGQDARQEVPMRTPKQLYAQERIIYQPELLTCPHCGDLLVSCNYLAWDKTVQMLDRVLSVASRPGRCPHATCVGSRLRLLSAAGQGIAPAGSTYGYDVVVRIGWWRQESRATHREMHAELASQVRISASHVGYLYQQVYLPLLACHERQHRDHLARVAKRQGGLIVALDGLAPQGGEPQIWFIRELSSGLTLRSGWLCQQDQTTFEAFLEPLTHLEWPILAVLSDKQTGLAPAVAKVFPNSRYQFCQAHYLRNLAEPLAEADSAFKGELRNTVRQHVGDLIRQEPRTAPGQAGVLTVTGLLPSPLEAPQAPASQSSTPRILPTAPAPEA